MARIRKAYNFVLSVAASTTLTDQQITFPRPITRLRFFSRNTSGTAAQPPLICWLSLDNGAPGAGVIGTPVEDLAFVVCDGDGGVEFELLNATAVFKLTVANAAATNTSIVCIGSDET